MEPRRRLLDRGRVGVSRHQQVPLPPPPRTPGSPSQAPLHGQGLGIGLAILSLGGKPGGQRGGSAAALFPKTPVLDTFDRADSASLGANWTRLNPGGALGYTSTVMGIAGNQAYDPDTIGANKASAAWNPSTITASTVEAFFAIGVPPGDFAGVALRAANLNGIACKYYLCRQIGTTWGIDRTDSFSSATTLTSGSTAALAQGDIIGGRVSTVAGSPVVELWKYTVATGNAAMLGSVTDMSASKITADGNIGFVFGNANGSSVGRANNFGGGGF